MSFGFVIDSDEERDGYTSFKDENGDYHTTITRIKRIYDVSAVGIPANPGTEIDEIRKRSYLAATIEAERKAAEEAEAERKAEEERAKQEEDERVANEARMRRMRRARAMALNTI
jgi:phage head maturation protease